MNAVSLLGRILFPAAFFTAGLFGHLLGTKGTVAYARAAGAPLPDVLVPLAGIVIVAASIMMWLGIKPRLAALAMFLFLLPTTIVMHRFWGLSDPMTAMMQQTQFMKNTSLMGAALLIMTIEKWPLAVKP